MKPALATIVLLLLTLSPVLGQSSTGYLDIQIGRSWPRSIAVNPLTNQVFVTTASGIYPPTGFTITAINAVNNSIQAVIPYPGIPGAMAIDTTTDALYLINSSSVVILDGRSNKITGSVRVNAPLYDVAFDSSSGLLYATSATALYRINPDQLKVLASVPVGSYAEGIDIDPKTDTIYVANFGSSSVTVVDGGAFNVTRTIALPQDATPSSLAFDSMTGRLFVTTGRNYLLAIDGGTGNIVARIEVGSYPTRNSTYAVVVDPHLGEAFVAIAPGTLVTVVDASSYRVISNVKLEYAPFALASNPVTGVVYVTNYHLVSVIAAQTFVSRISDKLLILAVGGIAVALATLFLSRRWLRIRSSGRPLRAGSSKTTKGAGPGSAYRRTEIHMHEQNAGGRTFARGRSPQYGASFCPGIRTHETRKGHGLSFTCSRPAQ